MHRIALIARVPATGGEPFAAYESAVLPLLSRHGGALERRVRHIHDNGDWTEIHIVAFDDAGGLDRYRADPERAQHAPLLASANASMTMLVVDDVSR